MEVLIHRPQRNTMRLVLTHLVTNGKKFSSHVTRALPAALLISKDSTVATHAVRVQRGEGRRGETGAKRQHERWPIGALCSGSDVEQA